LIRVQDGPIKRRRGCAEKRRSSGKDGSPRYEARKHGFPLVKQFVVGEKKEYVYLSYRGETARGETSLPREAVSQGGVRMWPLPLIEGKTWRGRGPAGPRRPFQKRRRICRIKKRIVLASRAPCTEATKPSITPSRSSSRGKGGSSNRKKILLSFEEGGEEKKSCWKAFHRERGRKSKRRQGKEGVPKRGGSSLVEQALRKREKTRPPWGEKEKTYGVQPEGSFTTIWRRGSLAFRRDVLLKGRGWEEG